MALHDLPNEIWHDILGYVPRSAHHKLMGVNRFLFEHALDNLYEEIRLVDDDRRTITSFEQILAFPSIARRVRRVLIQPTFLPGLDESKPHKSRNNALKLAASALGRCPSIQEVAFVLTLQRFSIKATLPKMESLLLSFLISGVNTVTSLHEATFHISESNIDRTRASKSRLLQKFLLEFGKSLSSITLVSNSLAADFVEAFASPRFTLPNLKQFRVTDIFGGPSELTKWSAFIARHAVSLEVLCIKQSGGNIAYSTADRAYSSWINPPGDYEGPTALTGLVFPNLQSLQIGLRGLESDVMAYLKPDLYHTRVLPNILTFAPNLKTLILTGISLSFRRVADIVNDISPCATLLKLDIMAATLSAEMFDLLAIKLPHLRRALRAV